MLAGQPLDEHALPQQRVGDQPERAVAEVDDRARRRRRSVIGRATSATESVGLDDQRLGHDQLVDQAVGAGRPGPRRAAARLLGQETGALGAR